MNWYISILTIFCVFNYIQNLDVDYDEAKILVTKSILNNYVVENQDLIVKYTAYNVGTQPGFDVKIQDENFPSDKFDYASGFPLAQWSKLSPASNVSHTAILKPKISGLFNFTHATVSYVANERTRRVQIGYSTELGEAYIQRLKDYNRRFASHLVDWILFVIMALPSILFPYVLWYSSKRKYENVVNKAKKEKSS